MAGRMPETVETRSNRQGEAAHPQSQLRKAPIEKKASMSESVSLCAAVGKEYARSVGSVIKSGETFADKTRKALQPRSLPLMGINQASCKTLSFPTPESSFTSNTTDKVPDAQTPRTPTQTSLKSSPPRLHILEQRTEHVQKVTRRRDLNEIQVKKKKVNLDLTNTPASTLCNLDRSRYQIEKQKRLCKAEDLKSSHWMKVKANQSESGESAHGLSGKSLTHISSQADPLPPVGREPSAESDMSSSAPKAATSEEALALAPTTSTSPIQSNLHNIQLTHHNYNHYGINMFSLDQSLARSSPSRPQFNHINGHSPKNRRSSPPRHPDWQTYDFLDIFVRGLPLDATTLDIHKNFRRCGNVTGIKIQITREGHRAGRAEIRFKPPPKEPFWDGGRGYRRFNFAQADDQTVVTVQLSATQKKNFTVKSPVRAGVVYDEQTILTAEAIEFGVLTRPESMMIMNTKTHGAKIILNLQESKKEIEIHFSSSLTSDNHPRGLMREFRFLVALDQRFAVSQTQNGKDQTVFIFHLESPPPFSKKLVQALSDSHKREAVRWYEDDSWARQTDFVDQKETFDAIDQTPVSVYKNLNRISLGRWNTFRVTIGGQASDVETRRIFREALQDYNIPIKDIKSFKVFRPSSPPAPLVWSVLDKTNGDVQFPGDSAQRMHAAFSSVYLPFSIRYQLEVCISHGWLSEYNIDEDFLRELATRDESNTKHLLECVASRGERFFDPMEIFDDMEFRKPIKQGILPDSCVEMYHATVTATSLKFHTPSVEMTNRVVRQYKQYADRFLRVRFEDDEYRGNSKIFGASNNRMVLIFNRVKRALRYGITLGDRHYEFLAWGNSQLREHGVYFFAGLPGVITASQIRALMGEFDHEKIVAKRAARVGQCFSTTRPVRLRLPRVSKDNLIPDISKDKYTFTDGVGMISKMAAIIVADQLGIPQPTPSIFQFRLGGCKGILAVNPKLPGMDIKIRPSQFKFNSEAGELEIIRHSQFWHSYLNRQLILVLSELGVGDDVFLRKQRHETDVLAKAMNNDEDAIKALRDHVDPNQMTLIVADMVSNGFRSCNEPFVTSCLHLWRTWCLKYLKEKAKLHVTQGAFVLGTVDETGALRGHFDSNRPLPDAANEEKLKTLPEVFLQVTDPQTGRLRTIEEICIIARNPSLHPGDIRVVNAVDKPGLRHLRDVLVMPQTGDRDIPSMCSGGDLDGDDYIVIWDKDLIPTIWNVEPFHYDPPLPVKAQGEISQEDFITFFHDYMQNDFLGRIAHAHLGWADYLFSGINSEQCLELVQLHSMAVDYPKTGVPANLPRELEPPKWPHYMERKRNTVHSTKILGQLYDNVDNVKFVPNYKGSFDRRILDAHIPHEKHMVVAEELKRKYDRAMQRIMAQHHIKTEFEVWTTFVLDHSKAAPDYKFHEEIGQLSKALKGQYHAAIVAEVGGRDVETLAPFAVAAYKLTHAEVAVALKEVEEGSRSLTPSQMPFISFPWLLQDALEYVTKLRRKGDPLKYSAKVVDGEVIEDTTGQEFDTDGSAVIEISNGEASWTGRPLGTHGFAMYHADPADLSSDDEKNFTPATDVEPISPGLETVTEAAPDSESLQTDRFHSNDPIRPVYPSSSSVAIGWPQTSPAPVPSYGQSLSTHKVFSRMGSQTVMMPRDSTMVREQFPSADPISHTNHPQSPLPAAQTLPSRPSVAVRNTFASPRGHTDEDAASNYHNHNRRPSAQSASQSAYRHGSEQIWALSGTTLAPADDEMSPPVSSSSLVAPQQASSPATNNNNADSATPTLVSVGEDHKESRTYGDPMNDPDIAAMLGD